MQAHSANWDAALAGSVQPAVQIDAWYDGELISDPDTGLPGISGSVTIDGTRLIVTSATLTAASPDGSLIPSRWDSPLACFGTELHIRAGFRLPGGAVELLSVGWFRIDSFSDVEQWQRYPGRAVAATPSSIYGGTASSTSPDVLADTGTDPVVSGGNAAGTATDDNSWEIDPVWVPRSTSVPVDCSDRMALLDDAQFLAPAQPASLGSVIIEIQRLCQGIVPVADLTDITDKAIPKAITYDDSRSGAVAKLAALLGRMPRMNPDGALDLYPATPSGDPVWTVSVDSSAAPPVASWTRQGDRSGLYNAVVYKGTDANGNSLQSIALDHDGPLRYGGPFGRVPFFVDDNLATTQADVNAGALTALQKMIAQRTVIVPVVVPTNWALEAGDIIAVELPDRTLTGPVTTIDAALGNVSMTVSIAVPRADLWGPS